MPHYIGQSGLFNNQHKSNLQFYLHRPTESLIGFPIIALCVSHLFVRNAISFDEFDDSGKQTPYMSSILRNLNRFITSARAISYCRLEQKLCARSFASCRDDSTSA